MTYAAAAMNLCIAHCNLSAAIDHYETHSNLCSTILSTLETCGNLSTAADLQLLQYKYYKNTPYCKICGTQDDLSSNATPLF